MVNSDQLTSGQLMSVIILQIISGQKSQLTAKALAELDAGSTAHVAFPGDDAKSMISETDSADTFRSWASNWSDCTNATFNRVHRYWKSNSALHKEVRNISTFVLVNWPDDHWDFVHLKDPRRTGSRDGGHQRERWKGNRD